MMVADNRGSNDMNDVQYPFAANLSQLGELFENDRQTIRRRLQAVNVPHVSEHGNERRYLVAHAIDSEALRLLDYPDHFLARFEAIWRREIVLHTKGVLTADDALKCQGLKRNMKGELVSAR